VTGASIEECKSSPFVESLLRKDYEVGGLLAAGRPERRPSTHAARYPTPTHARAMQVIYYTDEYMMQHLLEFD
jgi:hypothetical protein